LIISLIFLFSEVLRFIPHHLLKPFLGGLEVVPFPVENARRFFTGLVHVVLEVHVVKALLHRVSLVGVEDQHLSKEVKSGGVGVGVDLVPFLLASLSLLT